MSVSYIPPGTTPSWAHLLGRGKAAKPRAAEPKQPAKVASPPIKTAIAKPAIVARVVKRAASKLPSFSHFLNPAAHVWTDDEPMKTSSLTNTAPRDPTAIAILAAAAKARTPTSRKPPAANHLLAKFLPQGGSGGRTFNGRRNTRTVEASR